MTDRHTGYVVTLAVPIREDDAEHTLNAVRQIKGVVSVDPIVREPFSETATKTRRDMQWAAALRRLVQDGPEKAITGKEGTPGYVVG